MTDLARLRPMLAGDAAGVGREDPAGTEWILTLARIDADFRDVAQALATVHRRFQTEAAVHLRELEVKRIRVRGIVDELKADLIERPPRTVSRWAPSSPDEGAALRRGPGPAAYVMLAILYGVLLVVIVAIVTSGGPSAAGRP